MLRCRHFIVLFLTVLGAGYCTAGESTLPDKSAPTESPLPVNKPRIAEIIGEEAVDIPASKPAKEPSAPARTEIPTPASPKANTGLEWIGGLVRHTLDRGDSTNSSAGAFSAAPLPAGPTADDKPAPDKPAPVDKPADKTTVAPTEVPRSNRSEICDEEMESVYAPKSIEGYAGFKRNKVYKDQLIDNDLISIPDRWRIAIPPDSRHVKGNLWNPFRQNMLKGDYPIIGQSMFLVSTFTSDTLVEGHSNPTPAGVSTHRPGSFEFFGRPDQYLVQQNFITSFEFFKGETDFKPREWEIRMTPVFNVNYTHVEENFAINIDPRERNSRIDGHVALQEAFGEYHFRDLSPNYDFVSSRTGIQSFNEDFRGFLFADNNLGTRIFGNLESNRLQYNLAGFEMLNKDTNSGLNTFNFKDHHVVLANVIRQDTFWKGYNIIGNFAFSDEETTQHYNENHVIVRPAPIGNLSTHANKVYYVGIGGDGHIGRLNLTHQFYQAFGTDTNNNLANHRQHINAQMFAFEGSYDMDWMRFRSSYFYASGDHHTFDGKATGFDSIFDDPNFAGGQFSWWVRQGGFGAGNALTQLKSRNSLLPNLNTSKGEGQRNFVNPGLHLFNAGYDAELTQNFKAVMNVNYLQFDDTSSVEELLHQNGIDKKIGYDYSIGVVYRPFLNNQMIISAGVSGLTPLQGFKDIYSRKTLYAGFMNLTLRY